MPYSKYRTGPRRIAASIADRMLFFPLLWVEQWLYYHSSPAAVFFSWLVLCAVLHLLYSVVMHNRYGHTLGKWLFGVRVMDLSETRYLTLSEACRRESVYLMIEVTGILIFFYMLMNNGDSGNLYESYRNLVRNVGLIWVWLILISMLSNPKRRSIHDYLGGSVVVRG